MMSDDPELRASVLRVVLNITVQTLGVDLGYSREAIAAELIETAAVCGWARTLEVDDVTFSLTVAEVQGWISSIGELLIGVTAAAAFVQGLRNRRMLRHLHGETKSDVGQLAEHIIRVEIATNGMKRELEAKAFEDGMRAAQIPAIPAKP